MAKSEIGDPRWDNDGLGQEVDALAGYVEQNPMSRSEIADAMRDLVTKREDQAGRRSDD